MSHTFADFHVPTPSLDEVRSKVEALCATVRAADSAQAVMHAIAQWDQVRWMLYRWKKLPIVRHAMDTRSVEQAQLKQEVQSFKAPLEALERSFTSAVLCSPHRAQVQASLGQPLMDLWAGRDAAHRPQLADQHVALADAMDAGFSALAAPVQAGGSLHGLRAQADFSSDRARRQQACEGVWHALTAAGPALEAAWMKRVALGTDGAATGSHDALHAQVRDTWVPRLTALRQQQARALGIDQLAAWDERVWDLGPTLTCELGPGAIAQLIQAIDPTLSERVGMWTQLGLMDLEDRPHKLVCGHCNPFFEEKQPFLWAAQTGHRDDLTALAHQVGHALQWCQVHGWWRPPSPLIDTLWAPGDVSEIHGTALELLALPHLALFFGDQAPRARHAALCDLLQRVVQACALDLFERTIYANLEWDLAAMHACWARIQAEWMPWRSTDQPAVALAPWLFTPQLFLEPLTMVDQALGAMGALQLVHAPDGLQRYLALCARGLQGTSQQMFTQAGLVHPLEGGVAPSLAALQALMER